MPLVLLVEDDQVLRPTLARVLEAHGFTVAQADDGGAALDLLMHHQPDVILLDILLPVKDGLEVIMEIRRIRHPTKIIAMSGGGRDKAGEFLKLVRKLGADAALSKPFSNVDLIRTMRMVLGSGLVPANAGEGAQEVSPPPPEQPDSRNGSALAADIDLRFDGAGYRPVPVSSRGRDWLFVERTPLRMSTPEARELRLRLIRDGLRVMIDGQTTKRAVLRG